MGYCSTIGPTQQLFSAKSVTIWGYSVTVWGYHHYLKLLHHHMGLMCHYLELEYYFLRLLNQYLRLLHVTICGSIKDGTCEHMSCRGNKNNHLRHSFSIGCTRVASNVSKLQLSYVVRKVGQIDHPVLSRKTQFQSIGDMRQRLIAARHIVCFVRLSSVCYAVCVAQTCFAGFGVTHFRRLRWGAL